MVLPAAASEAEVHGAHIADFRAGVMNFIHHAGEVFQHAIHGFRQSGGSIRADLSAFEEISMANFGG